MLPALAVDEIREITPALVIKSRPEPPSSGNILPLRRQKQRARSDQAAVDSLFS